MQLLGTVLYFFKNRVAARSDSALSLAEARKLLKKNVFADNKKIGSIVEIFGPVKAPYISIKTAQGANLCKENMHIYVGN